MFLQDDATRCPQARSRDSGGDPRRSCPTGVRWRKPRGGDRCAGVLEALNMQLVGDVPGCRLGCAEAEAPSRAAEEAQSEGHPLDVPDGGGTQSAEAGLSFCAVDALDDCAADSHAHWGSAESGVGRAPARAAGADVSETLVACALDQPLQSLALHRMTRAAVHTVHLGIEPDAVLTAGQISHSLASAVAIPFVHPSACTANRFSPRRTSVISGARRSPAYLARWRVAGSRGDAHASTSIVTRK